MVDVSPLVAGAKLTAGIPQEVDQQYAAGRQNAIQGTLAAENPNDPASVAGTLALLTRQGATEQANAQVALSNTRTQAAERQKAVALAAQIDQEQSGQGTLAQAAAGAGGAAASPPPGGEGNQAPGNPSSGADGQGQPQTAATAAAAREKLLAARDGVEQLQSIDDPAMRKTVYTNEVRPALIAQGLDPKVADQWAGDFKDGTLQDANTHFSQLLDTTAFGGTEATHPEIHPNTVAAAGSGWNLNNPEVQAYLAHAGNAGMDTASLIKGIEGNTGYKGPVGEGQTVALGGQMGETAPVVTPVVSGPGQTQRTPQGAQLATNAPLLQPTVTEPQQGITNVNVNPNAAPGGAGAAGGAGGAGGAAGAAAEIPSGGGAKSGRLGTPLGNATLRTLPPLDAGHIPTPQTLDGADPGGRVSSGYRTDAHNAEVGGVADSAHLTGNAYDWVPAKGETAAISAQKIMNAHPGVRAIAEGDHVHVMWAGAPIAGTPGAAAPAGAGPPGPGQSQVIKASQPLPTPTHQAGIPGLSQTDFGGHIIQVPNTGATPDSTKSFVAGQPAYQAAQSSVAAYNQLRAQAGTMTGPAAVGMLASIAGLSPGASFNDITQSFGQLRDLAGKVEGFGGTGVLTPAMRQEIVDAAYGQTKAKYDQGASLVSQARSIGQKVGGNQNLDIWAPPIAARPERYFIPDPTTNRPVTPPNLPTGDFFSTPNGRFQMIAPGRYKPVKTLASG